MVLVQTPLNYLIKDTGFQQKHGRDPIVGSDSQKDRIQAHLEYVCNCILKANNGNNACDDDVAAKRLKIVELLREYSQKGEFPSAFEFSSTVNRGKNFNTANEHATRTPCFIDNKGVHCAAGYLMMKTGYGDLAQDINNTYRFHYIHEMLAESKPAAEASPAPALFNQLNAFLRDNCLTVEEVATIQPTYDFEDHYTEPISPQEPQITVPTVQHINVRCDNCGASPIAGVRFKCANCADYDLCETCEANNSHGHAADHVFLKIKIPLAKNIADKPLVNINLYK